MKSESHSRKFTYVDLQQQARSRYTKVLNLKKYYLVNYLNYYQVMWMEAEWVQIVSAGYGRICSFLEQNVAQSLSFLLEIYPFLLGEPSLQQRRILIPIMRAMKMIKVTYHLKFCYFPTIDRIMKPIILPICPPVLQIVRANSLCSLLQYFCSTIWKQGMKQNWRKPKQKMQPISMYSTVFPDRNQLNIAATGRKAKKRHIASDIKRKYFIGWRSLISLYLSRYPIAMPVKRQVSKIETKMIGQWKCARKQGLEQEQPCLSMQSMANAAKVRRQACIFIMIIMFSKQMLLNCYTVNI